MTYQSVNIWPAPTQQSGGDIRQLIRQTLDRYVVRTVADYPELQTEALALEEATWEKLGFLDHTKAHATHYEDILDNFPDYHLCLVDLESGRVVATGNCAPVHVAPGAPLSEFGWDWIVDHCAEARGQSANHVGALAISVPEENRQLGLARMMINAMRFLATSKGFGGVVAPVRPSSKTHYPEIAFNDYLTWKDDRGRIFDPWLRSHVSAGGLVLQPCAKSMIVEKPVSFWQEWTQTPISHSGQYTVRGALVPVEIDLAQDIGRYVEPNIWVLHQV